MPTVRVADCPWPADAADVRALVAARSLPWKAIAGVVFQRR